jgi:hypothetical protein
VVHREWYMAKSVSHAVSPQEPISVPRADMGSSWWYSMRYGFFYVIFFISYISTIKKSVFRVGVRYRVGDTGLANTCIMHIKIVCILLLIYDICWILHVKICITCRINPRTLHHLKSHRPEEWYRSRVDTACDKDFDM